MSEFFMITVKELLSRIQRLETQVSFCIQNQELLFAQASNCQLAQDCLKLARDMNVDVGDEQLNKRIGQTGTETSNENQYSSWCSIQEQQATPSPSTASTPTQPQQAQIPNTKAQAPRKLPCDEVGPLDELSAFVLGRGQKPTGSASASSVEPKGPPPSNLRELLQKQLNQRQVCHKCEKVYSTPGGLRRHIRQVRCIRATRKRASFLCRFCDASYGKRNSLRAHEKRKHGQISSGELRFMASGSTGASKTCDLRFDCQLCAKSFRRRTALGVDTNARDPVPQTLGDGGLVEALVTGISTPYQAATEGVIDPTATSVHEPEHELDVLANLSLVWGPDEASTTTTTRTLNRAKNQNKYKENSSG